MFLNRIIYIICLISASFVTRVFTQNNVVREFPKGFQFGVSTSAYQIEGAWNIADKGESTWDRISHTPGLIPDGSNGNIACDSYHLYKRDVEMLAELGVDFYRFSISWTRLLPHGTIDKISEDGLRYYNALINELISRNITPVVTLYHFDLPQVFRDTGGWYNEKLIRYFVNYANIAFASFGDRVKNWLTFNEPNTVCSEDYTENKMTPFIKGVSEYQCSHIILKAHAEAYRLYQNAYKTTQKGKIGLTFKAMWFEPVDGSIQNLKAQQRAMEFQLGWFAHPIFSSTGDYPQIMKSVINEKSMIQGWNKSRLPEFTPNEINHIKDTWDFFGLNYYTTKMVKAHKYSINSTKPSYKDDVDVQTLNISTHLNDGSGPLHVASWGFTNMLYWIKTKYKNPKLIIFENGYPDGEQSEDKNRMDYYHFHLNALLDAVDYGCNIVGYSAWTLMDNFQWSEGYRERFGLYHVDFNNPNRTRKPKKSSFYYKSIIESGAINKCINSCV